MAACRGLGCLHDMTMGFDFGMIGNMERLLLDIAEASWQIFEEASLYVLMGFLVVGIMRVYLRPDTIARYFRRGRIRSVFSASLLGIPVPI